MAIVGVLAAIAIPNFIRYQERAKLLAAGGEQQVAAQDAAGSSLAREQLESLEWVRQVRQQIEAKQQSAGESQGR